MKYLSTFNGASGGGGGSRGRGAAGGSRGRGASPSARMARGGGGFMGRLVNAARGGIRGAVAGARKGFRAR